MDMTSLITTLLSSDSVSGVGKAANADKGNVQSVLNAALPLLLNGAKAQSEDKSTAESFANALLSHGQKDTSNVASFLKNVDLDDGAKIIGHLLGNGDSVKTIAKESGVSSKETSNILSAAAPLLMSLLGQETKKSAGSGNDLLGEIIGAVLENVDLGDVLGALLGGSSKKTTKKAAADDGFGLDDAVDLLGKLLK